MTTHERLADLAKSMEAIKLRLANLDDQVNDALRLAKKMDDLFGRVTDILKPLPERLTAIEQDIWPKPDSSEPPPTPSTEQSLNNLGMLRPVWAPPSLVVPTPETPEEAKPAA